MVDTIEEALNPLFLVIFIVGGGILGYPLDQSRHRLSILYILTVWSVYAGANYYIKIQFSLVAPIFGGFLVYFMLILNLFVTIISIIITVYKHEKFYICMRKLDLVNDTLEELGTPKNYHRLRNVIKWAMIMLFFVMCTSCTLDSMLCIEIHRDTKAIIIPFIMDYSLNINTIMDIMFMLLLRHIGCRLDKINDHIIQLSQIEDYGLRCKWKKSLVVSSHYVQSAENRRHVLWTVMHLHLELCRTARKINGFFGVQMTLQMLAYFVVLIAMFSFQYNTILHMEKIYKDNITLKVLLATNMWFIIFLMKLISLNYICESVSAKAQRTKDVIHRLTNLICFAEVREEISQFILQISLRPLKFSGLGLFYFGYDFIRKFFVWILTAVLFLVQTDVSTPQIFTKHYATYDD